MQGAPDMQIQNLPISSYVQASNYALCGHWIRSINLTKCLSLRQETYKNYTETKLNLSELT